MWYNFSMKKIILSVFLFSFIILSFYKITSAETKKIKLSETGFFVSNLEDIKKEYLLKSDHLIKVTSPNSNKTYRAGDKINVKWTDDSDDTYDILIAIISEEDIYPYDIVENELNDGYYQFTVNEELPSGKYFIVLGYDKSDSRFAVSKSFTIKTKTKASEFWDVKADEYYINYNSPDTEAKLNINNTRAQAEIFYDTNGNYSNVCKKGLNDYGIKEYVKDAGKATGKKTDCDSSAIAWAAEVKLKSENAYYCADSTGYADTQIKSKGAKAIACDGTKDNTKIKNSKTSKDIISEKDHFLSGNASSKIKIITYSDLECPYCAQFDQTLRQISKEYGDKLGIVFRHFPLSQIHKNAEPAANAVECVANLGGENKFSPYIEKLFSNYSELDFSNLSIFAQDVGINKNQFETCLLNEKYSKKVKADSKMGSKFVTGTPYSVIYDSNGNTQEIFGAQPFGEVKRMVESVILK